MILRIAFFLAATGLFAQQNDLAVDLDRVAKVSTVMIDGDICRRIQTLASPPATCCRKTRAIHGSPEIISM